MLFSVLKVRHGSGVFQCIQLFCSLREAYLFILLIFKNACGFLRLLDFIYLCSKPQKYSTVMNVFRPNTKGQVFLLVSTSLLVCNL